MELNKKTHFRFWSSLFILNSLFFLTRYIFDPSNSPFFPFKYFFESDWFTRFKMVFIRPGFDIFRISVELVLFTTLLLLFRNKFKNARLIYPLFWLGYLVLLFYSFYHGGIEGIYQSEPLFFNDIPLLQTGASIISSESIGIILGIIAALGFILWLTFKLGKILINATINIRFTKAEKIIWMVVLLLVALNTKYGFNITTRNAIQPISVMFYNNMNRSKEAAKSLASFDIEILSSKIPYNNYHLNIKPNIYLIAIESYGQVIFTDDSMRQAIVPNLIKIESEFKGSGWFNASALSVSPAFGGKSWVAYSSILYGFNFKNQGTYEALFNNPEVYEFPSWPNVLKGQGYKSIRLNSLPPADLVDVPWEQYSRFYNIDQWIRFEDLDYNGKSYGFGPAPPDQYSFYKAMSLLENQIQPLFFFFLNQNTHHPFESPEYTVDDWRSLNDPSEKQDASGIGFLGNPNKSSYIKAINYQFDYLSKYILNHADSNDIFILIGDHQPPFVSDPKDGMAAPVHIISKYPELINDLLKNGFQPGMVPEAPVKFHHSGIYSVFMHALLSLDTSITSLPKIYPLGLLNDDK